MKKFLLSFVAIMSLLCMNTFQSSGQVKITTKKMKLSDFTTKTTKVVLGGEEMFNNALKQEITKRWLVSPYEFCTTEEYEANKENSNYYFLVPVSSKMKKEAEPGIIVLSMVKGGPQKDEDATKEGFEVVSIPCAATSSPSGREFVFLPAFIDIIQRFMNDAMASDRFSYGGLSSYSGKMLKEGKTRLVFSKDDLSPSVSVTDEWADKGMEVMDEDDADELFSDGAPNTMVSFVVAPVEPVKGSVCYKMVISAETHELCYFEKHQIKDNNGAGFLPLDIKIISLPRKK